MEPRAKRKSSVANFTPRAEPVAWSVIVAAILAAAASYGFEITDELQEVILLIAPFVIAGIIARFNVYAPDTVKELHHEAYVAGRPPVEREPDLPPPA